MSHAPATPGRATGTGSLGRLLRLDRRKRLREALAGSWEDRWRYCWGRQMALSETDLRTYGVVRQGERQSAVRLLHQYHRLTRLAERWASKETLR